MDKWIKVLTVGLFNGLKHSLEDLKDFVNTFNVIKLNFLPDIKLTHEDTKEERDSIYPIFKTLPFTFGKISDMKVEGNTLYVKYSNLHKKLEKYINDKLLTTHSIEFYEKIEFNGKNYNRFLTAVALLPAGQVPALFEEFEPYMYLLENQSNSNDFLASIELNNKLFCNIQIKEDLTSMPQENQEKKVTENSKPDDSTEKTNESPSLENLMKQFYSLKKTVEEKESKISELEKKVTEGNKHSYSLLVEKINELEKKEADKEKELKVMNAVSFVHKYSKGSSPSISVAQEATAIFLLSNVPKSDEKVKYSLSSDKNLSYEDTLKHFIEGLPVIKHNIGKDKIKDKNGVEINLTDAVKSNYSKDTPEAEIYFNEKIKKYAKDNNLKEPDVYLDVMSGKLEV